MTPEQANKIIRKTFRVIGNDTIPLTGRTKSTRNEHLGKLFNTLGYKLGAEIGVENGYHAKTLFRNIEDLKLICVDPWTAYNQIPQEKTDERYARCRRRLRNCNVEYMRMKSMEAVGNIPDGLLDFVYIDGLHEFDPVMMDIICWTPKVRIGGIIAGHDYSTKHWKIGVAPAVNAYTRAHNIREWYLTSLADIVPSWFWVRKEEHG